MAQPNYQIFRKALANGTLRRGKSAETQRVFGDRTAKTITHENEPTKNSIAIKEITEFLREVNEERMDILLATVGNPIVNPNSYGRFFSCNESVDVRFVPDVIDDKGNPYMGFGNSPEEAKKDLLQLLLKSGRINIPE